MKTDLFEIKQKDGRKLPIEDGIWNVLWSAYQIDIIRKFDEVESFNVSDGFRGVNIKMSINVIDGVITDYANGWSTDALNVMLTHEKDLTDKRYRTRLTNAIHEEAERLAKLRKHNGEFENTELDRLTSMLLSNDPNKKAIIRQPFAKPEEITVGRQFVFENNYGGMSLDIRIMTITYVRSGIAFYVDDKEPDVEQTFPLDCWFTSKLEALEWEHDLNPDYFETVSNYKHKSSKHIYNAHK